LTSSQNTKKKNKKKIVSLLFFHQAQISNKEEKQVSILPSSPNFEKGRRTKPSSRCTPTIIEAIHWRNPVAQEDESFAEENLYALYRH
jgi:hypothetical protein